MSAHRPRPRLPRPRSVGAAMLVVLIALLPALLTQTWLLGTAVLRQVMTAVVAAIAVEALAVRLAGRAPRRALADGSAVVCAVLLALALPPGLSVPLLLLGVAFALLLGKHAYGGLGNNPFNPAMAGYAALLVSFPADLASWPAAAGIDALTAATPLDMARHGLGAPPALEALARPALLGAAGDPWPSINLAYLAGGIGLLLARVADAAIPAGVLAGVTLAAALPGAGPAASVQFHLTHGATMAAAFFIATDPVSAPAGRPARLLYGALVGTLIVLVREQGGYPDGVAFAVLLGNAAAPLLERLATALRRGP